MDKAKVNIIEQLPPPISIKRVGTFLDYTGFYGCYIKDFFKITKSLT